MYINGVLVKANKILNSVLLFLGITVFIIFGATWICVSLEGETSASISNYFLNAAWVSIGIIVLSLLSKKITGSIFFYARYFEGDIDGIIKPQDMVSIVGKGKNRILFELRMLKTLGFMKKYKIKKNENEKIIELESIITTCRCRNCGAEIEKKVYFTGNCPYCGGIDALAKEVKR